VVGGESPSSRSGRRRSPRASEWSEARPKWSKTQSPSVEVVGAQSPSVEVVGVQFPNVEVVGEAVRASRSAVVVAEKMNVAQCSREVLSWSDGVVVVRRCRGWTVVEADVDVHTSRVDVREVPNS
jgi:hypothetical protein